ncbi:leucine-rich repeat domain-containing protein [Oligoflexus tunisiensis]|uniref:leucine-rich repeat domain-containing protein n=1 Tax=Oligoflexus tunisiensis TaxID=708132 RepID=UPI00114CF7FE|nr:leucine-rich repeat domain-containing protein [Oligoflexus tunisiensis]
MSLVTSLVFLAAAAQGPSAWVASCQKTEPAAASWNTYRALAAAVDLEWKNDLERCRQLESALKKAQIIDLRNESVQDLTPVYALEGVTQLLASGNQIKTIAGIEEMKNLEILDLGNNAIADISAIPALKKLNQLRLAKNEIRDIKPLLTMTQLEKLSLAYNKLRDIEGMASLQKLNYLSIASNEIKSADALKPLKNLQVLNLSFNLVCSPKALDGFVNKGIKIIGRDNQNCKDRPS